MVGVLIGMKLRLLRHSFRGRTHTISVVAGAAAGLVAAVATMLLANLELPGAAAANTDLAALLFAAWTLGWLIGPIFVGGSDESLQPEHFRLLPLSSRRLATGLLVSSAVGIAPVISLLAFAGLLGRSAGQGAATLVVALVGVLLQLAFVLALSRVVVGALGAVMRSRRGQDLGILLAAGVGLLVLPLQFGLRSLAPLLMQADPDTPFFTVLRWLPSGWAPVAVRSAAEGDWALALGALAGLAVLVAVLWLAWSALLGRRLTRPEATMRGAGVRVSRGHLERLLPDSPAGAVAAKEIRLWWRDARRRSVLLPAMLVGVVIPLIPTITGDGIGPLLPYMALFIVATASLNAGNLYGFDGTALWHTLVMPDAFRADIRGRQLGWLAIVGPVTVIAAVVLPAVAGRPETYPHVLGLLSAALGGGAGILAVLSVFTPFPVPPQRGNPFAAAGNPGCSKIVLQLGLSLVVALSVVPPAAVLVLSSVTASAALAWAAVPVGLASGVGVALWWGRIAYRRLAERGPEILVAVRPKG